MPTSSLSFIARKMDILSTNASNIQNIIGNTTLSSAQLVEAGLAQISTHNTPRLCLRGLKSVAPRAHLLEQTRALNNERKLGRSRGQVPFHPHRSQCDCSRLAEG